MLNASALLVLCGDIKCWNKSPEQFWKHTPQSVQDFIVPSIKSFYQDREQVQRDEVMRSCGMLGMSIMLKAKEMGYDSCPMIGFDIDKVGEIIQLPEDYAVSFIITVGKATTEPYPYGGKLSLDDILVTDQF